MNHFHYNKRTSLPYLTFKRIFLMKKVQKAMNNYRIDFSLRNNNLLFKIFALQCYESIQILYNKMSKTPYLLILTFLC